MRRGFLTFAMVWTVLVAGRAEAGHDQEWRFDVRLDGSPIGSQTFRRSLDGDLSRVSIDASFDVKILFFTAYTYRHHNEEVWDGDCLRSLTSTTDDNGDLFEVNASAKDDGFVVKTKTASTTIAKCPSSFAYWNPKALRAQRLLNSQTGEYEEVALRELGPATVDYRGQPTPARHVALEGPKLRIELWYGADDDWIALESTTKSGRKLQYVRQ